MTALELTGISKTFGRLRANDNIDLSVSRGEIHGLLGENGAGKTTLMNILFGLLQPDSGTIEISGTPVTIRSPREALDLGIGMVHQHFQLVPTMTVAENIAMISAGPLHKLALSDISDRIRDISQKYGLEIDPNARISDLSVGRQQRVEIIKLLFRDAKLIVLDEPTAVLTPDEWKRFTPFLRLLTEEGRSIIFISHKLEEQFDVSDTCTVLRQGRSVGTKVMAKSSKDELIEMMIGRNLTTAKQRKPRPENSNILVQLDGIHTKAGEGRLALRQLDLNIRAGEIVGIAGVDGNGQDELVDVLIGLIQAEEGQIKLHGKTVDDMSPGRWRDFGGALVTADRHATGVALELDLADNLLVIHRQNPALVNFGTFINTKVDAHVSEQLASFDVRTAGPQVAIGQLSGGNQQKLVLAREMNRPIDILVAAHPTRGLDIGAAETVHERIMQHRDEGGASLLISTELSELIELSDRIAVMSDGRFSGILENDETFEFDRLAALMAGGGPT